MGRKSPCRFTCSTLPIDPANHFQDSITDAGALTSTTWVSAGMPSGLVKSVSVVPAVEETTTIEVTALVIPS